MNLLKDAISFFRDAYYELTKVTWLDKKEVTGITLVVVVFVVVMSIFVSVVDLFFGAIVGILL
ncbi:MAG: preprotein translocase subunit SecE [Endomicrobium sp.]|jgi:preprotein translocase subunit SecE|nr:preprotein translocase subunit SecE [Endomicrobium sp.]